MKFKNALILLIFCLLVSCKANFKKNLSVRDNFDALWEIIDTKYCFFDVKKINWDSVKVVYEKRLPEVKTEMDFFYVCADMLNELNDGHVNLFSSFDVSRCRSWYENYPVNFSTSVVYGNRYLTRNYKIAGGFHYQKIADGTIGLIRYDSFSSSFTKQNLHYIDLFFKDCNGIIIDVRSNGGGSADYSKELAACFFAEKSHIGYIQHKIGTGHNDFSEPQAIYIDPEGQLIDWSQKRVVVLCNRQSYSATNDFLSAVQYAPNVTLVGGISGGGGGIPLSNELPIGWLVRFSAVPTYDRNMNHIEFGIQPKISVDCDAADAANGIDTIIEKAIEEINSPQNP